MTFYYTYYKSKRNNEEFYVLDIQHPFRSAVLFFKSKTDLEYFISNEHPIINEIPYAHNYTKRSYNVVKEFIENDNLVIGENGRTYDKRIFNC